VSKSKANCRRIAAFDDDKPVCPAARGVRRSTGARERAIRGHIDTVNAGSRLFRGRAAGSGRPTTAARRSGALLRAT